MRQCRQMACGSCMQRKRWGGEVERTGSLGYWGSLVFGGFAFLPFSGEGKRRHHHVIMEFDGTLSEKKN